MEKFAKKVTKHEDQGEKCNTVPYSHVSSSHISYNIGRTVVEGPNLLLYVMGQLQQDPRDPYQSGLETMFIPFIQK